MGFTYDCAGWATKSGVKCADGRTIMPNAFKDDIKNGKVVPVVWQHQHDDPRKVLGHALLENRHEGVYAYVKFNDSELGETAKNRVHDRDISQFSIYANRLKQSSNKEVYHGKIRELSIVLAGANPEAVIDQPFVLVHSDDPDDLSCEDAYIFPGESEEISLDHGEIENGFEYSEDDYGVKTEYPFFKKVIEKQLDFIEHKSDTTGDDDDADKGSDKTVGEIWNTFTEKQKKLALIIAAAFISGKTEGLEVRHSDSNGDTASDEETVSDVYDSLNDDQKKVLEIIVGAIVEESKNQNERDDSDMKHNIWDADDKTNDDTMAHSEVDILEAMEDAKSIGSMKKSFLEHGINHIDYLYPEDHNLNTPPAFIKRPDGWVQKVLGSVHHTPFSKIKSQFADITGDEARARGYIKGDKKENEVFTLLRRSVGPTTIYKKQEFDRDDMIDIVDFDTVAWIKAEMRGMLDEEIARAILVSDGRPSSSRIKIKEDCIIPIWKDDPDLFTISARFVVKAGDDENAIVKKFIRTAVKARKHYRGSGQPTLFTTEDLLTDILLLTDNVGRDIYEDDSKVAKKLRVKEIVTVPVMENLTRTVTVAENETATATLLGIIVNLIDYNVGADKGGAVNMFDDFDIDYNKQKYLIETRCSGALTVPFSAIIVESIPEAASSSEEEP